MYFLLDTCQHPGILKTLYFGILIRDIAFTLIPIGLILLVIIDFSKAVIAGDAEKQRKTALMVPKRLMYGAIIFIIPWIVDVLMNILDGIGVKVGTEYNECIKNAKTGNFEYYDNLLEAEEEAAAKKRREDQSKTAQDSQKTIDSKTRVIDSDPSKQPLNGKVYNTMAKEMLKIAAGEIGNTDSSRYGAKPGLAWCASFTTWVMKNTVVNGVNLYNDVVQKEIQDPNSAGASCTMNSFKNSSHLYFHHSNYYTNKYGGGVKYTPKGGDIIYFDWTGDWDGVISNQCGPGGSWISHIGIVEYSENGRVHTIEGNSSNQVKRNDYSLDSSDLVGYGSWYTERTDTSASNNVLLR